MAEAAGAHAFELNLHTMAPEVRTQDALAPVFEASACPIFTAYRRFDFSRREPKVLAPTDDLRIGLQLSLIPAGSAGFDMELDSFDPSIDSGGTPKEPWFNSDDGLRYSHNPNSPPREVSNDPVADRRQREVVEEARSLGGEVILSTHALTRLSGDAALSIGQLAKDRGADIVKIVRLCTTVEDSLETLQTNVLLARELPIPFVMMAMGEYGKITRPLAAIFGSLLVYCRESYSPDSFMEQPLIANARAVLENLDATITPRAARFLPPELR
jgi:hypothetical protein